MVRKPEALTSFVNQNTPRLELLYGTEGAAVADRLAALLAPYADQEQTPKSSWSKKTSSSSLTEILFIVRGSVRFRPCVGFSTRSWKKPSEGSTSCRFSHLAAMTGFPLLTTARLIRLWDFGRTWKVLVRTIALWLTLC